MKLKSTTFANGSAIPARCAFGVPDSVMHMSFGSNHNPQLAWSKPPDGTRSLVLTCIDPDVPSSPEGINEEGHTVPEGLPRVDFAHWVMVDIPPTVSSIDEGACSDGVIAGGKHEPPGPPGTRQGLNDYTGFMAGDRDMRGEYIGYDGPCPPWNDERVHHYRFTIYATDLERCPVSEPFTVADVLDAIEGHVLAEASLTGTYTLNPERRSGAGG
jgi:Raf kinase inhibitor-like YbhB/YbcL family protein